MAAKTKRKRFEDIGAKRVQKLLDAIDSLSKCANPNNYEYSDADVKKMINTIKEKVRSLEFAFSKQSNASKNSFKF